jgi:hypothetical protein
MFVRVKKIGPYEYLYLVENAREGGRHVQRAIKALGRRDEIENSDLLDGLIASAARHSRRSIVLSRFYRGELAELRRRSIGPNLVFGRLWEQTGCREVLQRHLHERQFGFDAERAIYLTVLHRLMVSGSDRHASTWRETVTVPGAEAITLDHAYKAMAWLGEDITAPGDSQRRSCTDEIEEALYAHRRSLFGELAVAFFDTTSLYFEGRGGAKLGQRGHSKDFRPQLNQVVLGIVLDEQDRPILPVARQHRRCHHVVARRRTPAPPLRRRSHLRRGRSRYDLGGDDHGVRGPKDRLHPRCPRAVEQGGARAGAGG